MTYHDNDVVFLVPKGWRVVSGSYTVTAFAVTSGQDPHGLIHAGLVAGIDTRGGASFRVGRKGSSSVASWFNARVTNWQNTFNDSPGELNFAFSGVLTLVLTGGILSGGQDTFTFSDIYIAQGHTLSANNWWFGGPGCTYTNSDKVTCEGVNAAGKGVFFTFQRGGGSSVDQISVVPTLLMDTARWMETLDDDLRLDGIMMPGSHDAGMSTLAHCAPPEYNPAITRAQSDPVGQQLQNGSRYFDIRIDLDHGELVTYHRTSIFGCNGQRLQDVLDEAEQFLNTNPSEIVIFKFSHIRDNLIGPSLDTIKSGIETMLDAYDYLLYKNPGVEVNLAALAIGRLKGRLLAVFDYPNFIDPARGRFLYWDGDSAVPTANLTVYDKFANAFSYDDMAVDQLAKWRQHGGLGQGFFFLLSWTVTPLPLPNDFTSIKQLASGANDALPDVLYKNLKDGRLPKPNVVFIDFMNAATAQSIILYNF